MPELFASLYVSIASLLSYRRGRPLKVAIQECELRWFHETKAAAAEGEANQMALLGHMYSVGYGCKADPEEAAKWFSEASKRLGYNVLTDQSPIMQHAGPPDLQQQQQQQPQAELQRQQQSQQQQHQERSSRASSSSSGYPTRQSIMKLGTPAQSQTAAAPN